MTETISRPVLDQLFRLARTRNGWKADPVYDLAKWGPTAANSTPARFVFVTSVPAKEKLVAVAAGNNKAKIMAAPVTAIIGYDLDFPETLPKLFPHVPTMKDHFTDPVATETGALRNSSLQGAYLMIAARALGLDCGPMSGFDNAGVDAAFFAGTRIKSNFLCSLGHGTDDNLFPRLPRHTFDEACKIV
jgi:3-hydroxypropanoate dehydrogenase